KELDFISHKNRGEISENFCVFCSKETPAGRSLYFSPDTGRYTSRIIANYYWTACEEPSENDIDYLLFPTAGSICWSLLKS
ncbi:MAG: hypothetical protein KKE59_05190, partial [Proteobacteria bacterium]|nr:hypothetical protein [Pseudomonadota bacterium]